MSIIRNLTVSDIALNDLAGITIIGSSDYNLSEKSSNDIANSQDLNAQIASGNIIFIDNEGIPLTQQESLDTQNNISAIQSAIIVQDSGINIAGTPHNVINFLGNKSTVVATVGGVADISIFLGLDFNTIGNQEILTLVDSSRANKMLSIEKINYLFSKTLVSNDSFFDINSISNDLVGYVMPFNATIVGITTHKISGTVGIMNYDLYVDNILRTSTISSTSGATEEKKEDNTLNIDVNANEKITIRGITVDGGTQDSVSIVLYVRWRV